MWIIKSASTLVINSTATLNAKPESQTAANLIATNGESISSIAVANNQMISSERSNIESPLNQKLNLTASFTPELATKIKWMFSNVIANAEIMMDPPELGPLTIRITQSGSETSIVFNVPNLTTKEMIEDNMSRLKEMLQEQGLKLGDAQVEQQAKNSDDSFLKPNEFNNKGSGNEDDYDNTSDNEVTRVAASNNLLDVYS